MSLISVNNLTFCYETNYENIFENTSFDIDTDWKLGFIGRNGRGKTTFLQLLMGKYKYVGTIASSVQFDYFPFKVDSENNTLDVVKNIIAPFAEWEFEMNDCIAENTEKSINRYGELLDLFISHDGYIIEELIEKEIRKLDVSLDVLMRPFISLSNGERTKLMLAALFLKKNNFLLIDEPTNHLDFEGRKCVGQYLSSKKGFILVSHDRYFLDNIVDHIISINRNSIDVQKGNFSSWQDNKNRQDNFEIKQNENIRKDIVQLEESFRRTAGWSDKIEKSKIGEHAPDRGYIGHKAAKMMKRAKSIELRKKNLIDDKKKLLKDIERNDALKIHPLKYSKSTLINVDNLAVYYDNRMIFEDVSFTVNQGDRIALRGKNGCGKSSIIKLLIGENISFSGNINIGGELIISYISQDTSFLSGTFKDYSQKENIDETLFRAILSKLDFSSNTFDKDLKDLSGGQKKKVLIAKSLSQIAHVYIWDEPLNFIDVLSRMQIEKLIKSYEPTMVFVEHDYMFNESIATKVINL